MLESTPVYVKANYLQDMTVCYFLLRYESISEKLSVFLLVTWRQQTEGNLEVHSVNTKEH